MRVAPLSSSSEHLTAVDISAATDVASASTVRCALWMKISPTLFGMLALPRRLRSSSLTSGLKPHIPEQHGRQQHFLLRPDPVRIRDLIAGDILGPNTFLMHGCHESKVCVGRIKWYNQR